ncbi:MAG: class I SAM-dependent methyltransferase [Rhodospirillaceae bacterium]|nr:class I SAM-dependent methyltransferase [Rhodospirillaceae bacterium]
MDAAAGYVTEIEYVARYYRELNPHLMRLILAVNGLAAPDTTAPFAYMELGFGKGLSLAAHAAANPHGRFYGVDIIPAHVEGVQALSSAAGLRNLDARAIGFAQLAGQDYPDFDIIALHGVWSWVNAENRAHIVRFIADRLKPGGIVYLSYNALPGWAPVLPLRQAMKTAFDRAAGSVEDRVRAALAFADQLRQTGAKYFKNNPQADRTLTEILPMAPSYLAHEYFNADWTPFHFADVAADLASAGLSFAGPAQVPANITALNFTPEAQTLLKAARDQVEAETIKGVLTNTGFRRDLFVRAGRRMSPAESAAALDDVAFAALVRVADYPGLAVTTALGKFKGKTPIHIGLVEALADGPMTLGALRHLPTFAAVSAEELVNAAVFLVAAGAITVAGATVTPEAIRACRALNATLTTPLERGFDSGILVSPVTGAALELQMLDYLFTLTRAEPGIERAFAALAARGQTVQRDGQPLAGDDTRAELVRRRTLYDATRAPVFRMLGVAD